jgi:hypothetical protein
VRTAIVGEIDLDHLRRGYEDVANPGDKAGDERSTSWLSAIMPIRRPRARRPSVSPPTGRTGAATSSVLVVEAGDGEQLPHGSATRHRPQMISDAEAPKSRGG